MFDVRIVDEGSIEEQVDVFCDSFEILQEREKIKENWYTKHYCNPNGNSLIFAAYDGDLMVGINAFMPLTYEREGQTIAVLQSCESGVRRSHRRKGIWQQVMSFATDYLRNETKYVAIIGFPNYKNSYNGFLKLGWTDICNMSNLMFILNGIKTIEAFIGHKKLAGVFKLLELQKIPLLIRNNADFTLSPFNGDLTRYVDCYDSKYHIKITNELLEWKKRYKGVEVWCIHRKEKMVAVFIGRKNHLEDIPYYELHREIYLSTDRKEMENSFKCFVSGIALMKQYAFIRCWEIEKQGSVRIHKYFLKTNAHPNPFIIMKLKDNAECDSLERRESWDLSFMDLD